MNATADAELGGKAVCHHDGGYSTFRVNVTDEIVAGTNDLKVTVEHSKNDRVYPQKADFTFYGGIYRDVKLLVCSATHFALDYYGTPGLKVTPHIADGDADAQVQVESWVDGPAAADATVRVELVDAAGNVVASGEGTDVTLPIAAVHRWDGVEDPYLYTARLTLVGADGAALDEASARLAHYQHNQVFYDACDEAGLVVWAEIPYISEHLPDGRQNTLDQMHELIVQNYNHASICVWGLSNEITISTKDKAGMLDNHHVLNDLVHRMDPTRPTTLACYAMCGPFNKSAHISDVVSWNLYLGWYVPGLWLNKAWFGFWRLFYRNRAIGMSEYGCEAMPNLHSERPRRNDHIEEYHCVYHEYMLKFFARRPYFWATHVWNMFDFAADARDQGGEPGMNHKGLVTFDRKTKKDSFYIYKAWWSKEPFVHVCSKRFEDRCAKSITVKAYSNQPEVTFLVNGQKVETVRENPKDPHVFRLFIPLAEGETRVEVVAGECRDEATWRRVHEPNAAYKLVKKKGQQKSNWADNE